MLSTKDAFIQNPKFTTESVSKYCGRLEKITGIKLLTLERMYYRHKELVMTLVSQTKDANGNITNTVEKLRQTALENYDLPVHRVSTKISTGEQWVIQQAVKESTEVDLLSTIKNAVESLNKTAIKLNPSRTFSPKILNNFISDVHAGMDASSGFLNYDWNAKKLIDAFSINLQDVISQFNLYGRFEVLNLIDLGDTLDGFEGLTTRGGHLLPQNMTSEQQFSLVLETYVTYIEELLQADIAHKIIITRAENDNHCFTQDVEVLTNSGWKYYTDLTKKDLVASKNMNTGEILFEQPLQYVFNPDVACSVHTYKNKNIDISVTEEHRMLYKKHKSKKEKEIYEYITSKEAFKKEAQEITFQVSGLNLKSDYSISDELIRFAAWVITDGSITKNKKKIPCGFVISQAKEVTKDIIRKLLYDLGISCRESEYIKKVVSIKGRKLISKPKPLTEFIINNKHTGEDKVSTLLSLINDKIKLPEWLWKLSKRQFDIFLKEVILADGSVRVDTSATISGTKNILNQLQSLCVVNNTKSNLLTDNRVDFLLSVVYNKSEITFKPKKQLQSENYTGYIWCLTMPQSNLVVRRNGKISIQGNSGSFNSILGYTMESIFKKLYPTANIEFKRIRDFIGYSVYGKNAEVFTHGKDRQYMKSGLPYELTPKAVGFLNSVFKRWGISDKKIRVYKADLHQLGMSRNNFFEYYNMPAFSPPSGWVQTNFGAGESGYAIHVLDRDRGTVNIINHTFDS